MNNNSKMDVTYHTQPRNNSSVDIEGYSLLPDIWDPSPDLSNSQYGKIVFTNVKDCYQTKQDLLCTYSLMDDVEPREGDRVAIFCVGWTKIEEVVIWVEATMHAWSNEDRSVVFPAFQLPPAGSRFYQFCYLSNTEVRGASIPFNFVHSKMHIDQAQNMKNNGSFNKSPQKNSLSIRELGHHTPVTNASNNVAAESMEHSGIKRERDVPLGPLHEQHPEVVSEMHSQLADNEQYAPDPFAGRKKDNEQLLSDCTYRDRYTPVVPSTSGVNNLNDASPVAMPSHVSRSVVHGSDFPACRCNGNVGCIHQISAQESLAKLHEMNDELQQKYWALEEEHRRLMSTTEAITSAKRNAHEGIAQLSEMNNELQRKYYILQEEHNRLITSMDAATMENLRLKTHLDSEMEKNGSLCENLRRFEAERDVLVQSHNNAMQENAMRLEVMEKRLETVNMENVELKNMVSNKKNMIQSLSGRLNAATAYASALRCVPQVHENAALAGGSEEQMEYIDGGAWNTDRLPQPFNIVVQRTKRYLKDFLMDRDNLRRKVHELICLRLIVTGKLREVNRLEKSLTEAESDLVSRLGNLPLDGEVAAIFNRTAERIRDQRELQITIYHDIGMLDEIQTREEHHLKWSTDMRKRMIVVFAKLVESFTYNREFSNPVAIGELENHRIIFSNLDVSVDEIMRTIRVSLSHIIPQIKNSSAS